MQYIEFKDKLKDFAVFSLADIRKIEPEFYRSRLNEWQDKGYIKKLRRGYYIFADLPLREEGLFLIANRLYAPSYVSFETALSHYGLIPEGVYSITSASSKKTAQFKTPIAEFSYRKIKSSLFFGYELGQYGTQHYKIAEIEKAVLDYLYFHPAIINQDDFYEWRFNSEAFLANADLTKLRRYGEQFKSKQLSAQLEELLKLIRAAK